MSIFSEKNRRAKKLKVVYLLSMVGLLYFSPVKNFEAFSQSCPPVVTTCFVAGERTQANSLNEAAIVSAGYNDRGGAPRLSNGTTPPPKTTLATIGQVGAVWGLAYNPISENLYASAFLKRHVDLSPDGLGAIYVTNTSGTLPNATLWVDINNTTYLGSGATLFPTETAANRGLTAPGLPSQDTWAYSRVGKQGIGDIEFSEDFTKLYVMDLTNKQLIAINMSDKSVAFRVSVPDPGCGGGAGNVRPFAIKAHNNEVYVGIICSAETTKSNADLHSYVYKLDNITAPTAMVLHKDMGVPSNGSSFPFSFFPSNDSEANAPGNGGYWTRPSPILSDIEFAQDGTLMAGYMDILGHMYGNNNSKLNTPSDLVNYSSHGNIVKDGQAANFFNLDTDPPGAKESPAFIGGMIPSLCSGSELLTANMQDPFDFQSNGMIWLNVDDGSQQNGNPTDDNSGPEPQSLTSRLEFVEFSLASESFGKANGLGDVVLLCIKPNAGTDQSPTCSGTSAITTATLAATAINGGVWSQAMTNPSGAVVTSPTSATSGVTGLNPGTYEFIWSTAPGCSDTVTITIPTCACTVPTATASATNATCNEGTANSDASITIAGFTAGQRYQYTSGATFTGTATPAAITAIPAGGVVTSTLPNTAGSYTVRIYDAADDACFVDRVVNIMSVTCAVPCPSPNCGSVTVIKN